MKLTPGNSETAIAFSSTPMALSMLPILTVQSGGKQSLLKTAKKFTAEPAERMVKDILGYRRRFVGLARQIDDTSVVVVKVDTRAM